MMSKLFGLEGQRHDKVEGSPPDLATLRRRCATENSPTVTIPKYRVRGDYVEYVLECATRHARWHVFRRYQQFKELDRRLRRLCPLGDRHHCDYGVLPVLTGSHWAEVTNQSADRVERRRGYLEIYLAQLLVPQNLFYIAGTALYGFLHDGGLPVRGRGGGIPPLIGLTIPEEQEIDEVKANEKDEVVLYSEVTPPGVDDTRKEGSINTTNNATDDRTKKDEIEKETETLSHAKRESDVLEKSPILASESVSSAGLGFNSENMEIEDIPSNDDTDAEDVRLPQELPLCLQCNEEYTPTLFPHRCFSCKQRFCRNCLRRVELADGEFVRACVQCYENVLRHEHKKKFVDHSTSSTLNVSSDGSSVVNNRIYLNVSSPNGGSAMRTDVSLHDFILVTTIGRGTFGKVMKVMFREDGKYYAMKMLSKCIIHKRRMIDYIKEEKDILATLTPHPYVVTCHFAFQTDYHLFFVFDYLPGGELYSLMYPKSQLSAAAVKLFIAEIVLALEHLHRFDIAHRDLKPENIVLGPDGHVKLTDFGLARMNFSLMRRRSFVGSAEYIAPETIQGEYQTKALDWWSLGVMLYEMLQGESPFHAVNNNEVYNNILTRSLDLSAPCFTPETVSLIQQLLHRDPKLRLSDPDMIKAHPYFTAIDWDALERKGIPAPVCLDLGENDTRYFKREFTAEWAVVQRPLGVSRASLDALTNCFGNFAYVKDEEYVSLSLSNGKKQGQEQVLPSILNECPRDFPSPQSLHGVWSLVKVEMATADGKFAYPWGSDVCGMLAYFPDGLFTMQLAFTPRRRSSKWNIDLATREELVDMYNSYAASFGRYQTKTGSNTVVHFPSGSLSPTLLRNPQRYFVKICKGNEEGGGGVMLKLSTAFHILREDGLRARTVLTWERIASP